MYKQAFVFITNPSHPGLKRKEDKYGKKKFIVIMPLLLVFVMLSCHRQWIIEFEIDTALIPIHADWSISGIEPQNVSVLFFDEQSGTLALQHYYENNQDYIQSYVELPEGTYTVLLFNELPGQVKNTSIEGMNNLNSIEAIAKKVTNSTIESDTIICASEPGLLAAILVKHLVITPKIIQYTNEPGWKQLVGNPDQYTVDNPAMQLMNLIPLIKISQFRMQLRFKGINNAAMPALIRLNNVSDSYSFLKEEDGLIPVTYQSVSDSRTYLPDSKKEGILSKQMNLFGVLGKQTNLSAQPVGEPVTLDVILKLIDAEKTIVKRTYNLMDHIHFEELDNGMIILSFKYTDPEPLPDVKPEGGSSDSGFEASVADWDIIRVPITDTY